MDQSRFVIADHQWRRWRRSVLAASRTPDARAAIRDWSLRRCFGLPGRVRPGVTCHRVSAIGTRSTAASGIGRDLVFLNVYSMR